MPKPRIELKTLAIIALSALIGAAWAWFNLTRAGGNGGSSAIPQLVWTVFAVPFFTFLGWLVARWRERWLAAGVCFCVYFFSIFVGARLELLIVGSQAATDTFHALYFRLTMLVQIVSCLAIAAQRAMTHGTMLAPDEGQTNSAARERATPPA